MKHAAAYLNLTGSLERRLGRSSDQTQKSYARAKEALLEPRTQKLARAKEISLERKTQTLRSVTRHTLERRNCRSSEERTNSLERRKSHSSQKPLLSGQTTKRNPRSIEETLARATDQNKELARAMNCSLKRRVKILGSNPLLPSSTNLLQPAHCIPQLRNRKLKDGNNHNIMAGATEPKSGYNNQMEKDRGRYNLPPFKEFRPRN